MGNVRFGIPLELARALVDGCGLVCAVETGTFLGGTAEKLSAIVPQVWSAEVDAELYSKAVQRFSNNGRVHIEHGSSPHVLARIAGDVKGPTLFWLDAHHFPAADEDPSSYCPAIAEIEQIRSFSDAQDSCILIDDARMFLGPNASYPTAEWPTLIDVIDALRSDIARYVTVLDDVIIAVPRNARSIVDAWWRSQSF